MTARAPERIWLSFGGSLHILSREGPCNDARTEYLRADLAQAESSRPVFDRFGNDLAAAPSPTALSGECECGHPKESHGRDPRLPGTRFLGPTACMACDCDAFKSPPALSGEAEKIASDLRARADREESGNDTYTQDDEDLDRKAASLIERQAEELAQAITDRRFASELLGLAEAKAKRLSRGLAEARAALDNAEAVMSIVEPRSDAKEYRACLTQIRAALSHTGLLASRNPR